MVKVLQKITNKIHQHRTHRNPQEYPALPR